MTVKSIELISPRMEIRHKVFAYITHGRRLLVFDHVHYPEAGTQVPAGTRPPDEEPEAAVLREAFEETGLANLRLVRFLGEVDMPFPEQNAIHRRRFYHLVCEDERPPERWQHPELHSSEGNGPIWFEHYWVDLPDGVPPLSGRHDAFLDELKQTD